MTIMKVPPEMEEMAKDMLGEENVNVSEPVPYGQRKHHGPSLQDYKAKKLRKKKNKAAKRSRRNNRRR